VTVVTGMLGKDYGSSCMGSVKKREGKFGEGKDL